jgi:cbb3-type cytochrome oxidase maturation protein
MSVLFVLVPVALLLVVIFVAAYAWSSRSGQFDDLTTPAMRVLHEEQPSSSMVRDAGRKGRTGYGLDAGSGVRDVPHPLDRHAP